MFQNLGTNYQVKGTIRKRQGRYIPTDTRYARMVNQGHMQIQSGDLFVSVGQFQRYVTVTATGFQYFPGIVREQVKNGFHPNVFHLFPPVLFQVKHL